MSEHRVDSRWWYWVAAVPVVTAFWLLSALWVVAVVLLVPDAGITSADSMVVPGDGALSIPAVVSIPAVALGLPAVVAFLVLPLALLQDSRAVERAGGDWSTVGARAPQIAGVVDLVLFGGIYLFFEETQYVQESTLLGTFGIAVSVVAGTWLCVRYLRERKSLVAMPGSLREWRTELRPEEQLR